MSAQRNLPTGQTYRVVDNWCLQKDYHCLLLRICPPGTLSWPDVDANNLWHFEIWDGSSRLYLNTASYTLLPLEQTENES